MTDDDGLILSTAHEHLDRRSRRRLLGLTALRLTLSSVALLTVYYLLPIGALHGLSTILFFIVGCAVFFVVLGWEIRTIVVADYPRLRAVEAVAVAFLLLIVVFSSVYFAMSDADAGAFTEPLTRSDGLYFTITVLSTVGFGDIAPSTDASRLVTSVQMLLDLALLGVVVRLIVGAVRQGVRRQRNAG
ncbi:potassium channel family protein [Lacisediminihabitans sp.]|uniref:potassium channel family protein n=1 Tax=Lacisediminihabitans sp. TaxID=2787631 RepID=UPI00374DF44E